MKKDDQISQKLSVVKADIENDWTDTFVDSQEFS